MLMWVMSDRAHPAQLPHDAGLRRAHLPASSTREGESRFVKFHWKPVAGTHSLVWDEAVKISGADPDFHRRDLWEAIEAGEYPGVGAGRADLHRGAGRRASASTCSTRPRSSPRSWCRCTPVGPHGAQPQPGQLLRRDRAGRVLHRARRARASTSRNDPLLAGRIHSYVDTQITRLGGPNFHEIPINAPVAQVHNNQRDGMHRQAIHRGRVAYEPNSLGGGCPFQAGARGLRRRSREPIATSDKVRGKPEKFADHYTQATLFYDSQTAGREGAHRRRLPLRADQGAGAGDPRAHGGACCATSPRSSPQRSPTGSAWRCPSRCRGRWRAAAARGRRSRRRCR